MRQTFSLHESINPYNEALIEVTIDTDSKTIDINGTKVYGVHRDLKELEYLHRSLGYLIEEIKE